MSAPIGKNGKPFIITVTEEIINNAIPRDSGHCVIADAVKASLNGKRPLVDLQTIRWTDDELGVRYVALTPARAQRVLLGWDDGVRPRPFQLRIYPFQIVPSGRRSGTGSFTTRVNKGGTYVRTTGPQEGQTNMNHPPTREGGHTPPVGALSNKGSRRSFGLHSAGFVELPTEEDQ